MTSVGEAAFEGHITSWLVEQGGYRRVKWGNVGAGQPAFDPGAGVDTIDLFDFIDATQRERWGQLVSALRRQP